MIKLKIEDGSPEDIEPLCISLKLGAIQIRAKKRRYPSPKREFMINYTRQFLKLGFVKPATSHKWVSPAIIVPKRPPEMYRLTIYYRKIINANT